MRGLTMDYQLTVPAIMRRSAMLFGERPIVSRDGAAVHRYRYADMLRRAKRLAGALGDLGVRPGALEIRAQVVDQLGSDRVQAVGAIERERGHAVGGLVQDGLGHGRAA